MGSGGGSGSRLGIQFPRNPGQIRHIFAEREGHVPDTFENRKLIMDTVSKPENYRGTDMWGIDNYSEKLPSGKQVWVRVRNNVIDDAGINAIEKPWDDTTGFKKNPEG